MVIGRVQHIWVEEDYARGYQKRYGKDGFMLLVPAPRIWGRDNLPSLPSLP